MSNPIDVDVPPKSLLFSPEEIFKLVSGLSKTKKEKYPGEHLATEILRFQIEKIMNYLESELAKEELELAEFNKIKFNVEDPLIRAHTIGKFDGQIKRLQDFITRFSVLE